MVLLLLPMVLLLLSPSSESIRSRYFSLSSKVQTTSLAVFSHGSTIVAFHPVLLLVLVAFTMMVVVSLFEAFVVLVVLVVLVETTEATSRMRRGVLMVSLAP